MFSQQSTFITVEVDALKSRIELVALDDQTNLPYMLELRNFMKLANLYGNRYVNVPGAWFEELDAAYTMFF